jgi:hypothetical protein
MNWKGCGRKRSWPNLRYYLGICLGLRKTTKNLSQNSQALGKDFNSGSSEYEAGVSISVNPLKPLLKRERERDRKDSKKVEAKKKCWGGGGKWGTHKLWGGV